MPIMTSCSKGDVVQVDVMGQSTVILGSVEAATELLDQRGVNNPIPSYYHFAQLNVIGRVDIL